jgi:predicted nucleic acid-binding protein
MAVAVLVDSSYFISLQRQGSDPFTALGSQADACEFLTCGMVLMEVMRGIHAGKAVQRYRDAFAVMVWIPTTSRVWDEATSIALSLDRKDRPIPPQDALIAAHALHAGAAVLTFDRHFRQVPGLTVLTSLT